MDSNKLKQIAAQSGTTVSTVRRVLSHCPGISETTRQNVVCAQCALNHPTSPNPRRAYCILPDNPKAFWHKAVDVLNGYPLFPSLKLSFYSSLQQSAMLTTYLQPLTDMTEAVLILSANLNDEQRCLVEKIAANNLVIQLCEDSAVNKAIYVGCDAYADGYELGKRASSVASRIAILQRPHNQNIQERIRGFIDALDDTPYILLEEPTDKQLYASHLARSLHDIFPAPDLLFCPGGSANEVVQAVHKLRIGTLRCMVLEPFSGTQTYEGFLAATVQQKLAEQTRLALKLATAFLNEGTFPEQERYIIPSKITYYD